MPVRLLDAWQSLEWWKIVPVGRSLVAQDITNFQSQLDLLPATCQSFPRPSPDLGYRLVSSQGNISLSDFVSTSIYLLSNQLHDPSDGDKGLKLLCLLFEQDTQLFTRILQSEPSAGRAAWESLFKYSQGCRQKPIFRFLLDFGIRHDWLDLSDFEILLTALDMEFPTDVVVGVLDCLCRSGHNYWRDILDAILMAFRKGYLEVANLLVQRFDINSEGPLYPWSKENSMSVFLAFVLEFDGNYESHLHTLDLLLANGADVDRLLASKWYPSKFEKWWYNKNEITRALRPTILDHSFRLRKNLFDRLAKHSKVPKSALTKTGLLLSLEKGPAALRDYLSTRMLGTQICNWRYLRSPLEFLLYDQCYHSRWEMHFPVRGWRKTFNARRAMVRNTDLKVVRCLIDYGVDWDRKSIVLPDIHHLLEEVLDRLQWRFTDRFKDIFRDDTDDALKLLDILVQKGADIRAEHLRDAVRREGTKFLNWLQPRVKNFSVKAASALAEAANFNNFEAVEFLLQSGADPNAFINARSARLHYPRRFVVRNITSAYLEQAYSVQAIAAGVGQGEYCIRCSLRMCESLAERGASLVVGPNDSTPFAFMMLLFENGWRDKELFAKIQFCVHTLKHSNHWEPPPAFLLELCLEHDLEAMTDEIKERLKIFEYLLDEGAYVNPGSPLAALAELEGSNELVERVLRLGANLNSFTAVCYRSSKETKTPLQAAASQGNEELVKLFLEQGANVNSPARGLCGMTALQAICSWDPATEQEHRRKMRICELLLSSGAEINAVPARNGGITALKAAVNTGDLELAAILIRDGARVNAPQAKGENSILDAAAYYGRLDIAKLLLESNSLSGNRGMTGYDGAIEIAQREGHHAVASLIRGYVGNGIGPVLDILAEDHDIHGYNTDSKSSYEYYWPKSDESSNDEDWSSADPNSSDHDAAEYDTDSEADSLMSLAPADAPEHIPTDTQALIESQAFENVATDDFASYSRTGAEAGDVVPMEWADEPDYAMGSLGEISGARVFPDMEIVANAPTDDWTSHSSTGFVVSEVDMQLPGNEWTLDNYFEPWAEMSLDGVFWQQGFETQGLDFGFPTFDVSRQLPSSDQLDELEIEGQDVAERDCTERD